MIWQLVDQTPTNRKYLQQRTGSECNTEKIYTDLAGRDWWGFADLFSIPYIRTATSKKISDLFNIGLSHSDLKEWFARERALLKGNDPDKYEKLFALLMEKESIVNTVADTMKQHLGIATIYVLEDTERIDYFDMQMCEGKLAMWALDEQAAAFFLSWQAQRIENYWKVLNKFSQTALIQKTTNKPL